MDGDELTIQETRKPNPSPNNTTSTPKTRTAAMPERMCVSVLSPSDGVSAALEVEYAQKYVARAGTMPTSVGGRPRKKPFTPAGKWWV